MAERLPEFDLHGFLPYRLTVAAERLSAGMARHYRDKFGISTPEWRVLVHLAHSGEVSVRDIEARVSMDKSKVSRAATRLEAEGYVAKAVNAGDRRLVELSLTGKGRDLMAELIPLAGDFQTRLERRVGRHLAGLEAALKILMEEQT